MNNSENKESIESLLKVENLDKNEYLVTATVVEPPVEKTEQKSKKVSLFGEIIINNYLGKQNVQFIIEDILI